MTRVQMKTPIGLLALVIILAVGAGRAMAQKAPNADASQATAPQVVVTPLTSATTTPIGQPIVLPKTNVQVQTSIYDIPVGATLAVHKHPYPRYAYVLSGKLRVVVDGDEGRTFDYKAGDFIIEVLDTWHHGTNIGTEPVRLLVIDQVEAGQSNTILQR